jgi:hypothetical protein
MFEHIAEYYDHLFRLTEQRPYRHYWRSFLLSRLATVMSDMNQLHQNDETFRIMNRFGH